MVLQSASLQIWMLERLRAWRLLAAALVEWTLKTLVSTPASERRFVAHLASVWDDTLVWGGFWEMKKDWRSGANWLAWIIIWAKMLRYSKGILLDNYIQLTRTQGRAEGRHKIWRCRDDPWCGPVCWFSRVRWWAEYNVPETRTLLAISGRF